MLAIGVVGCGAIGAEICRAVDGGRLEARLVGVSDMDAGRAEALVHSLRRSTPVMSLSELIAASDLVVEATSRAAAPAIIRESLGRSTDVMVMSVGGLLGCLDEVVELAGRVRRKIYVPSGAVAGLDGIKGAAAGELRRVRLTTRKPPAALAGAPFLAAQGLALDGLTAATEIFTGSAREAIPAFPANVNVAASLSLAGIGPDRTEVRIVADPTCPRNVHEIEAEGDFGSLRVRLENLPSPDNPKTSRMAALSAIGLLRRLASPLQVGS